ncbi:MAG: glutamine amidotransferase-related protein, partial [Candidatus Bipolaricaulota bacterium]
PFFGICMGMQSATIESARNILGFQDANSSEFDPETDHPVIDLMPDQEQIEQKGGTMRLGAYRAQLKDGTKAKRFYGKNEIEERHRHRYEFNNAYRRQFEKAGVLFAATSKDDKLVEVIELQDHPWFIGVQYHPEFESSLEDPHPLFCEFLKACQKYSKMPRSTAGS